MSKPAAQQSTHPDPGRQLADLVRTLGVHTPTAEQAAVITQPLHASQPSAGGSAGQPLPQPLLVVAGAGSGKTETMSLRAVYLAAAAGVAPESILGLTFTRKAAAELETRLVDRLSQLQPADRSNGPLSFDTQPQATTYNAFALDVVREFGSLIGIRSDTTHLDAAASWQLMEEVVGSWSAEIPGDNEQSTVADRALRLREDLAGQGISVDEARRRIKGLERKFETFKADKNGKPGAYMIEGAKTNQQRLHLLELVAEFERQKEKTGRLDFADQVLLANRIVRELPQVRAELRERHQVVFLDEFQDTSVAQLSFLSALFGDHPVTAVGDPNQAIYGWRGASAASLAQFHQLFATRGQEPATLTLSTAWRNSTQILDVANRVAAPLRERPTWLDSQPGTSGADGSSSAELVPSPLLQPRPGAGTGAVRAEYLRSSAEQVERTVSRVQELYAAADKDGAARPTVAVLCRRRALIAPTLEALTAAGITAETNGADGLLLHPAVLDLRAALAVADDIGRSSQLLRLLANLDLGARDLWQLGGSARKLARASSTDHHAPAVLLDAVDALADVFDSADQQAGDSWAADASATDDPASDEATAKQPESGYASPELTQTARRRIAHLARQLRAIRSASDRTVTGQVDHARRVLALDENAAAVGMGQSVAEVLDTFAAAAAAFQDSSAQPTLRAFLAWLDAATEHDRGLQMPTVTPDPGAVAVLTIHAAKGLEWDHVIVMDLESGVFPSNDGRGGRYVDNKDPAKGLLPPVSPYPQDGWWKKAEKLPYPLRNDAPYLPDPAVWNTELNVGQGNSLLKEDIGAYLEEEERRLAYVAFTRPRHSLLLLGSWVTTGRQPRYSSEYWRDAADTPGVPSAAAECPTPEEIKGIQEASTDSQFPAPPGAARQRVAMSAATVREEQGALDSQMRDTSPATARAAALASVADQGLAQITQELLVEHHQQEARSKLSLQDRAELSVRQSRSGSVWEFPATQLAAATTASDFWAEQRRPLPAEPHDSSAFGTAFHQWVEAELRRVAAEATDVAADDPSPLALPPHEAARLERLQEQFRQLSFIRAWQVEGVEIPFADQSDGILVRGRIDAAFFDPTQDRYVLVDWKTGNPNRLQRDPELLAHYLTQLQVYQRAWRGRLAAAGPRQAKRLTTAALVYLTPDGAQMFPLEELQERYYQLTGRRWELDDLLGQLRETLAPRAGL